jgi:hypothetical protein
MRIIIILIFSLFLVVLLFLSDFFLTNIIKEKINEINHQSQKKGNFKAVSILKIIVLSLLVWLVPLSLLPATVKLEYQIIITLSYWFILFFLMFNYLAQKTTRQLAKKCLPFLAAPALLSGIVFVPLFVILKELSR